MEKQLILKTRFGYGAILLVMQLERRTRLMPHLHTWVTKVVVMTVLTSFAPAPWISLPCLSSNQQEEIFTIWGFCAHLTFAQSCNFCLSSSVAAGESGRLFTVLLGVCMFKFHNRASTSAGEWGGGGGGLNSLSQSFWTIPLSLLSFFFFLTAAILNLHCSSSSCWCWSTSQWPACLIRRLHFTGCGLAFKGLPSSEQIKKTTKIITIFLFFAFLISADQFQPSTEKLYVTSGLGCTLTACLRCRSCSDGIVSVSIKGLKLISINQLNVNL